ncbi:MAG: hypothetical protein C0501_08805 [Isosphaera sp.]|nr:hypothetical protein [Isosphaera sp.]
MRNAESRPPRFRRGHFMGGRPGARPGGAPGRPGTPAGGRARHGSSGYARQGLRSGPRGPPLHPWRPTAEAPERNPRRPAAE